ncbi:hypothetical protein E308F_17940 [Moorella sp. E308F]|uniref:hypothetical protein n=1 Tax=unclassified Neomoorella TaxID=2676739 RepID=UPI0010FFB778|nr:MULTISPECIES: hypothetical protein [unclassified Moorella (in: firmicutes)]GEA15550.1 hypothetical protein E308F_17940 [Moorella sp. E308F]GEA19592.1 hypothetical protein E306M_27300 [Moorella sp. E306M]
MSLLDFVADPAWLEKQREETCGALSEAKERVCTLERRLDDLDFLGRVLRLLRTGEVVTYSGGFGWKPPYRDFHRDKDGTLHFLSPDVEDYSKDLPFIRRRDKDGFRSDWAYVVPAEFHRETVLLEGAHLCVPVVPLARVKHDRCPACGTPQPVMEWFHETYGSPEIDLCERVVFLVCCGGTQVLARFEFLC